MKLIYEYLDYREYLRDYYESAKKLRSAFSYQQWADRAGFKAKDFIFRVIRGESRLSEASINALAGAATLSKSETAYFRDLVRFNQAKTFQERDRYYLRLRAEYIRRKQLFKTRIIPHDHFELYAEWYHVAIRSLINAFGFSGDYKHLAKSVYPAISVPKARRSVALLQKLGLIKRDASGAWRVTDASISTGDRVARGALSKFYRTGMELMSRAMDRLPMDRRNVSGLTLGISAGSYQKIVERIAAFRNEISLLAQKDTEADRVYQMNFHLFPLSDVSGKRRRSP